jgi:hypothetical protein
MHVNFMETKLIKNCFHPLTRYFKCRKKNSVHMTQRLDIFLKNTFHFLIAFTEVHEFIIH